MPHHERARVPEDQRVSEARCQSLTVVLDVADVCACQTALTEQGAALERCWAQIPGLLTACLALLPPLSVGRSGALLLECSFVGTLAGLVEALCDGAGPALSAVLGECDARLALAGAPELTQFLSEHAQRAVPFGEPTARDSELAPMRWLQARLDQLRLCFVPLRSDALAWNAEELELRRSAVALQEPERGAPLLHVAWLVEGALPRVRRALRDVELEPAQLGHGARFLLHDERLLFFAYPCELALGWSERASEAALFTLSRIWMNARGFANMAWLRRARRERRLQNYLLDYRVPVGAWFNAGQSLRRA